MQMTCDILNLPVITEWNIYIDIQNYPKDFNDKVHRV